MADREWGFFMGVARATLQAPSNLATESGTFPKIRRRIAVPDADALVTE